MIMSTYIYDIVLGKGNDGPAPPRSAQATVADQISYRYTFLGTYGEESMANVEAVPRIPPPPIFMEWVDGAGTYSRGVVHMAHCLKCGGSHCSQMR